MRALLLFPASLLLLSQVTVAATAKDYAYLYVQGKIGDPVEGRPLVGATIRLRGEGETFEAVTDHRGSFIFDKLPVRSYVIELTSADGRTLRDVRDIDPGDPIPDRERVRVRLGLGPGDSLSIMTTEDGVTLLIPEPETRWKKLWKELAIFVGAAGLLAL